MFSSLFVCLFVCLLATLRKKTSQQICMKFSGKVGSGPMNKWLNFGGDPYHVIRIQIWIRIRITTLVRRTLAQVCTVPARLVYIITLCIGTIFYTDETYKRPTGLLLLNTPTRIVLKAWGITLAITLRLYPGTHRSFWSPSSRDRQTWQTEWQTAGPPDVGWQRQPTVARRIYRINVILYTSGCEACRLIRSTGHRGKRAKGWRRRTSAIIRLSFVSRSATFST